MPERLNDDQWRARYARPIGDTFQVGRIVFVRLVCAGCALSDDPRPVWAEKGTGRALCPRCRAAIDEARESRLSAEWRPNPGTRRIGSASRQYDGMPWYNM